MTQEEVAIRARMMLRAFTWDKPLPPGYAERMARFDSGEDRTEEFWGPEYRLADGEMDPPEPKQKWKVAR